MHICGVNDISVDINSILNDFAEFLETFFKCYLGMLTRKMHFYCIFFSYFPVSMPPGVGSH